MKSKIITFTLLLLFLSGCVSGFKQPEDGPIDDNDGGKEHNI